MPMRTWKLGAGSPLALRFAADARLGYVDYADDQSWEIAFGEGEQPALTFQTRYGGRAGIVRLVPMFVFADGAVYEAQAFAERPALIHFTPNFARIAAALRPKLALTAELWVIDSHTVGGRFALENQTEQPITLRLDLLAQAMREEQPVRMHMLALEDGKEALHLGNIGGLNPVLLLEGVGIYRADDEQARAKLSAELIIGAGETKSLRWVCSGERLRQTSLTNGYNWLFDTVWEPALARIESAAAALPTIETGDDDLDAALALGTQVLVRSFISATNHLPNPTFVTARHPARGFSPAGDGRDHVWSWNGQNVRAGYLALPGMALIDAPLALSSFRNWIGTAQPDGFIDAQPGAAGQRSGQLCPPLLAALAWKLYESSGDQGFLAEVYPVLRRFVERWFAADQDADGDGYPEWSDEAHSGYSPNPMFGAAVRWGQGADIGMAETPDLGAQLAREVHTLMQMAERLDMQDELPALRERAEALKAQTESLWNNTANAYLARDRDTHQSAAGGALFRGKGDDAFDARPQLDPPNRLLLRVSGGTNRAPGVSIAVEGLNAQGNPVHETLVGADLAWIYGSGACVTRHAYRQVNYVKFSGLSRVYSTEISTVDLTRHNLTHFLPLWAGLPSAERASAIKQMLTDPSQYGRAHGLAMCPASDPAFSANNENGSGGISMFWNTLMIEGLLMYGFVEESRALLHRLLRTTTESLKRERRFYALYNTDTGAGSGEVDSLPGILPLDLFMQCIGVRVVSAREVWAGGLFLFEQPIKVRVKGVDVLRSAAGTTITFPSGYSIEIDGTWQHITDPTPAPPPPIIAAPKTGLIVPGEARIEIDRIEAPLDVLTDEPPKPTPLITISDPDLPEMPAIDVPSAIEIPVVSKKDDTMEVPIRTEDDVPPEGSGSGTVKIPVKSE